MAKYYLAEAGLGKRGRGRRPGVHLWLKWKSWWVTWVLRISQYGKLQHLQGGGDTYEAPSQDSGCSDTFLGFFCWPGPRRVLTGLVPHSLNLAGPEYYGPLLTGIWIAESLTLVECFHLPWKSVWHPSKMNWPFSFPIPTPCLQSLRLKQWPGSGPVLTCSLGSSFHTLWHAWIISGNKEDGPQGSQKPILLAVWKNACHKAGAH